MGKTVEQLLAETSSGELAEWMAYSRLEPFGPQMDNWRIGMLTSVIANIKRAPRTKPYSPEDFMPRVQRQQSIEEMVSAFKALG